MAPLLSLPEYPGIFVQRITSPIASTVVALVQRVIIFANTTQGQYNMPLPIGSIDDFANIFGSSSSVVINSIFAYLQNYKAGLYVVRVGAYPMTTITVTTAGAATLTIGTEVITHTPAVGVTPTIPSTIQGIVGEINNNPRINLFVEANYELDAGGLPTYTNGQFHLRSRSLTPFVVTAPSAGLEVPAVAVPETLKYWDYISAFNEAADDLTKHPLAIACCPEAFLQLTSLYERNAVGNALMSAASKLRWFAMLDPGGSINTPIDAVAETAKYVGYGSYYFPWLYDTYGNLVSPAVMTACFALQRYSLEGIQEPPAGKSFPFQGIGRLAYYVKDSERAYLAVNRINPIIEKFGIGFIPYDILSFSPDPTLRFNHSIVVVNCIERSIYDTLDASNLLFQAIGSQGRFFISGRLLMAEVVNRFYDGGALFGDTADQAYQVVFSAGIQNNVDLRKGIVYARIFVVPPGVARQLVVRLMPVPIGQLTQTLGLVA